MLRYSREVAEKIAKISLRARRPEESSMDIAKAVLAVCPDFGPGLLMLAKALQDSGDLAAAEDAFWKALAVGPGRGEAYLYLGGLVALRRPGDPMQHQLQALAFWKFALADQVRKDVADLLAPLVEHFGSKSDPDTYGACAAAVEKELVESGGPEDERITPYRVLNDLQYESSVEITPETFQEVTSQPSVFVPLLHAAVREWANADPEYRSLDLYGLRIFVALLGEFGGPELIADLLELAQHSDEPTFLHVHWALYRLGQRYPEEALRTFRDAIASASPGMRCALAEQLNLLPEVEGLVPALALLVQGFAKIAKERDAPYLLALVTDAIAELGTPEAAQTILSKNAPFLKKADREWLEDVLNSDEGFMAALVDQEIDGLSIDDVCLGRVLMREEEEDEEGEDEEGEDEEEEEDPVAEMLQEYDEDEALDDLSAPQPVFIPKTGRNDPCPCGSGKKYKKCHLREDESAHLAGGHAPSAGSTPLPLRVFKTMPRWHTPADRARATKMYFGDRKAQADPDEVDGLVQFLLHDFRDAATGRTLIEHYLEDPGSRLTPQERTELESLRDARFGLYEFHRIEPGRGVHMRDVFSGDSFFVEDITSSRQAKLWDCGLLRVQFLNGRYVLAGNGTAVPAVFLDQMKQFVARESRAAGQSEAEFARLNSHRLRLHVLDLHRKVRSDLKVVNREGDPVEFGTAEYDVLDRPALLAKLRSLGELMEEEGEGSTARFGWLEAGEGPRSVYGHIEVSAERLRLEAQSRTRLVLGRGLLEYNAGPLLKHREDSYQSVDELLSKVAAGKETAPPRSSIPPEIERQAVLEVKARHYATWPDEKLPALQGRTPRQAVRTKEGRAAVLRLIRVMENGEAHDGEKGHAVFDFTNLRRELGLEGE